MKIRTLTSRFSACMALAFGLSVLTLSAQASGTGTEDLLTLAEEGNPMAQRIVGERFAMGLEGVPKDMEKGVFWLKKAADSGDAMAQFDIGMIYKLGDGGVVKDFVQAHSWFSLAEAIAKDTASGRVAKKKAENERKSVEALMTNQEIKKAQSLADAWLAQH